MPPGPRGARGRPGRRALADERLRPARRPSSRLSAGAQPGRNPDDDRRAVTAPADETETSMTLAEPARAPAVPGPDQAQRPAVELVVPVHDERDDLVPSVRRLHAYLSASFPFACRVTIADNAST